MKVNWCGWGIHRWKYAPWPNKLPSWFVLGAHYALRYCSRCERVQIPAHDCAWEYLGDYHWKTVERDTCPLAPPQ